MNNSSFLRKLNQLIQAEISRVEGKGQRRKKKYLRSQQSKRSQFVPNGRTTILKVPEFYQNSKLQPPVDVTLESSDADSMRKKWSIFKWRQTKAGVVIRNGRAKTLISVLRELHPELPNKIPHLNGNVRDFTHANVGIRN